MYVCMHACMYIFVCTFIKMYTFRRCSQRRKHACYLLNLYLCVSVYGVYICKNIHMPSMQPTLHACSVLIQFVLVCVRV